MEEHFRVAPKDFMNVARARVELKDLQKQKYNGMKGTVLLPKDPKDNRLCILLDKSKTILRAKPENVIWFPELSFPALRKLDISGQNLEDCDKSLIKELFEELKLFSDFTGNYWVFQRLLETLPMKRKAFDQLIFYKGENVEVMIHHFAKGSDDIVKHNHNRSFLAMNISERNATYDQQLFPKTDEPKAYHQFLRESGSGSTVQRMEDLAGLKNCFSQNYTPGNVFFIENETIHAISNFSENIYSLVVRQAKLDESHEQFLYSKDKDFNPDGFESENIKGQDKRNFAAKIDKHLSNLADELSLEVGNELTRKQLEKSALPLAKEMGMKIGPDGKLQRTKDEEQKLLVELEKRYLPQLKNEWRSQEVPVKKVYKRYVQDQREQQKSV